MISSVVGGWWSHHRHNYKILSTHLVELMEQKPLSLADFSGTDLVCFEDAHVGMDKQSTW